MNPMLESIVMGVVRSGALAAGGWVAAHAGSGITANNVAGSIICLVAAGFSVYDKFVVKGKIATALATPVGAPAPAALK